jgi:ribonuclease P/MRP protein subunit RPP1
MKEFYDLCLQNTSEEIAELASELGWTTTNCSVKTVFLETSEWGELKSKINQNRGKADVLVFRGGDAELNRKAAEDSRVDVILHPEKGRKDSGIDHVIAEKAAENSVAIGFDLKQLEKDSKSRSHILKHWMKNLKLCEKYDTPYIITSGAEDRYELRAPRDLESVIEAIGFDGQKAVQRNPKSIIGEVVTDGN